MATSIWEHFSILPDPRVERTKLHKLEDILTIAICAVICGGETWVDIAQKVLDKKGQYVLAVKGNQETLYEDIRLFLDDAIENGFRGIEHDLYEQTDKGHGRIETRRCWTTWQIEWLGQRHDWPGLRSIAAVDCRRQIGDEVSTERRYFISSLPGRTAQRIAVAVRNHWRLCCNTPYGCGGICTTGRGCTTLCWTKRRRWRWA